MDFWSTFLQFFQYDDKNITISVIIVLKEVKDIFMSWISYKITQNKYTSHCYCSEFSNFSSFQSFLTDFPSIWLFLAKKCTKMAFFDAVWRTAAKNQNKMSQAKMLKIRSYLVSWGTVFCTITTKIPSYIFQVP